MTERGWATSRETRTLAHYFIDGQSLCGRWTTKSPQYLFDRRVTPEAISPNDCVACTKKLSADPMHRDLKPSNVLAIFGAGDTVHVEGWFCDGTGELRKDLAVDATDRYIEFVIGDYASGGLGLSVGQGDNGWCVCVELLSVDPRVAIPWPVRISERNGSPIAFVECPDTTRVTWISLERLLDETGGVG